MIKSMTGFGRCEAVTDECKISVEIKAVNHRYLDLSIKMPKKFNYFEAAMRTLLKDYIQRGKVDVFITYEDYTEDQVSLKYNSTLAAEYMKNFEKMAEQFGLEDDVTVSMLSRCPEVLTMEQVPEDEEHMWAMLQEVLKGAAENFVETRLREGENLKNDLIGKLDHIEGMKKELLAGGSVGRKLDFIAQEMNRESNTILSKSNDLEISDQGILLKTEIEKVREQIQNIE